VPKHFHEIRDPIHVFIRLDTDERSVLDSRPFQRLRYVHQLALTYLVYPGATHRRFEHSLGVMELAGRVFDIVTARDNVDSAMRDLLPTDDALRYWRRVLRMAALCHDIGHLPFSHAGEELLPEGWTHERLTSENIRSDEMQNIWTALSPPLRADDIVKLAVGPKVLRSVSFSDWETVLAEIIVGNAFGVDRMDYLLRDSYHAGVMYGRFDHFRLIDTLRILPPGEDGDRTPMLGIEQGGLQSAEALLLARYFMFAQLYFHPVRRIYDIHLRDYLRAWLHAGQYSINLTDHLSLTDNDVLFAIQRAARDSALPEHDPARRIVERDHFRLLYERNPIDIRTNIDAARAVYKAACDTFPESLVRYDSVVQRNVPIDFPVLTSDGRIVSSLDLSDTLNNVPVAKADYVFIAPEHRDTAKRWLETNRDTIIAPKEEVE